MSASYRRGDADALAHGGPCQLVAALATLAAGAGEVQVYDGVDATGDLVYVAVTGGCEYTVVWV